MKKDFLYPTIDLVQEAGREIKSRFGHAIIEKHKPNDDFRTNADTWVEEFLYNKLKREYPECGFDSEERIKEKLDSNYVWVLDPIDGTKYFFQGVVPLYSVSLALKNDDKIIQGIVYIPETKQLFYASSVDKLGSFCNDNSISCSNEKPIEEMSIFIEVPNRNDPEIIINNANEIYLGLQKKVKRIRNFGVGSITLCYCAMGGFDIYLNITAKRKHYDFAAGQIILEQSGGAYIENEKMIVAGGYKNVELLLNSIEKK